MELKAIDVNGTPFFLKSIVDIVYPVGSIYTSVNSTSPSLFFGGTWEQIKGKFLYACEDSGITSGLTGGAKSVSYTPAGTNSGGAVGDHTLTVDEIPSHNHSFTGSEVNTGNQSAGHTHKYTDYYATTTGGTAISVAQLAKHTHNLYGASGATDFPITNYGTWQQTTKNWNTDWITYTGSSNSHTHSGANTSTTRTSEGISANHTHKVTAAGSIGNKGGGKGHSHGFTQPTFTGTKATINTMPPYLAVNVWKRTA